MMMVLVMVVVIRLLDPRTIEPTNGFSRQQLVELQLQLH